MAGIHRQLAVITGASSGMGRCFARQLAAQGVDLILVARRGYVLDSLKEELEKQHDISVESFPADLSTFEGIESVERRIETCENLTYLINNAGIGQEGIFPNVSAEGETGVLMLHNMAPMRLARAALIPMQLNQKGYIINMASAAGFMASRGAVDYTATKAFLITFSRSLQGDCVDKGILVQALCPGYVKTEFFETDSMKNSPMKGKIPGILWLKPDFVVKTSLRAVRRRFCHRVVCIPSIRYKWIVRFMACPWLAWLRILATGGKVR